MPTLVQAAVASTAERPEVRLALQDPRLRAGGHHGAWLQAAVAIKSCIPPGPSPKNKWVSPIMATCAVQSGRMLVVMADVLPGVIAATAVDAANSGLGVNHQAMRQVQPELQQAAAGGASTG